MPLNAKRAGYPLGAELTLAQLDAEPHHALARLREREPVSWVPALDGWLVTRRDLCIEVMRDAGRFTVDDPRFSTAQVVGPSMLSLDGDEHRRHRDPFARAFLGPDARARFADRVERQARTLVEALAPAGRAEIRRDLAGPLAVEVVVGALELLDVRPGAMLGWYDEIVAAVDRVSAGGEIGPAARAAVEALDRHVDGSIDRGVGVLSAATATLSRPEIASNAAVMLFGGIETGEGMTTTLFWHLLTNPDQLSTLRADRSLGAQAVEESLRLEPAAAPRRPLRDKRRRPGGGGHPTWRSRRGLADCGQPRPGRLSGPGRVRSVPGQRTLARCVRPGTARLRRGPPRATGDAVGARRRARYVAGPPARCWGDPADRGDLPQAADATGQLGRLGTVRRATR